MQKKTKFIVIKPSQRRYVDEDLKLILNDTPLIQVGHAFDEKCTKFLVIHIDESHCFPCTALVDQ